MRDDETIASDFSSFGSTTPAACATTGSTPFGITATGSSVQVTNCGSLDVQIGASVVDSAIEEAAQAIIHYSSADPSAPSGAGGDVAMAMTDELLAAVQGPAVRAALAARIHLIVAKGHSAESDDFLPIGWLPLESRQAMDQARDQLAADPDVRDLGAARAALVDSIAFGLAAIDRLDRAMKVGER